MQQRGPNLLFLDFSSVRFCLIVQLSNYYGYFPILAAAAYGFYAQKYLFFGDGGEVVVAVEGGCQKCVRLDENVSLFSFTGVNFRPVLGSHSPSLDLNRYYISMGIEIKRGWWCFFPILPVPRWRATGARSTSTSCWRRRRPSCGGGWGSRRRCAGG